MAASWAATGTALAAAAARTSSAIPVPAGVASGDLVIAAVYAENGLAVTAPTGAGTWTQLGNGGFLSGANGFRLFWKRATGADTGTYAFTHASQTSAGIAFRLTGALASGTPVELLGTPAAVSGTAPPAQSGTTTGSDELLVYIAFSNGFTTGWTPPTGYTERTDVSGWEFADKVQASPGATGSTQGTHSATGNIVSAFLVGVFGVAVATVTLPRAVPPNRARFRAALW